ncbi:ABC transporter related [Mizugakiibacter sediminis]|uniref:ABC transporter related n=2 Tax=Mizugakiibacter sediminis TaxID=1475481 RepID=A0A0K8QKY0_9GAMM|nr:hypothetical protein [Mizugakiibacter sediminis]GAP65494.1 ABC transporter related [Mizugakiibacter sediminis]
MSMESNDPAPPFRLAFVQRRGVLRAEVAGVNGTLETTLAYWRAIAAEVRARRPRRLLVVDTMSGEPPPPAELFQLVQLLRGEGFEGVRVAYVEADLAHVPQVEHGEIFAREAGFDVRVFHDERAAELWLRVGPE